MDKEIKGNNMKCKKCDNELFRITQHDCNLCVFNGAYDEEVGYIHNAGIINEKGLERTEAFDEGQCFLGDSHGNGCYIFECSNCHHKENMPLIDY